MAIKTKKLLTIDDFLALKPKDIVACEFHLPVKPKNALFGVFQVVSVSPQQNEVIWAKKDNIYTNFRMFVNGEGNLKSALLLTHKK